MGAGLEFNQEVLLLLSLPQAKPLSKVPPDEVDPPNLKPNVVGSVFSATPLVSERLVLPKIVLVLDPCPQLKAVAFCGVEKILEVDDVVVTETCESFAEVLS